MVSAAHSLRFVSPHGILALSVCIAFFAPSPSRAREPGPAIGSETYGYVVLDQSSPGCPFQYVDIAATGTTVVLQASGDEAPADDGGAVLTLAEPFELYGVALENLIVSSNGYLAAASSLEADDGGDFSNDCPLPAIPGNPGGTASRIYAYHTDLSGVDSGGSILHQHFPSCPRSSGVFDGESCTVVQWNNWGFASSSDGIDLQAVLYHQSQLVVLQIAANERPDGNATIGLQGPGARSAVVSRCNGPLPATPATAACFYDPRFPAGGPVADLQISKTDKADEINGGAETSYLIVVRNAGPSPVVGAGVSDEPPALLTQCSWSCFATEGSSCTTGPVPGGIDDETTNILPGGALEYTLVCTATAPAGTDIVNSAGVNPPAGVSDPVPDNNSATDESVVSGTDLIFADSFESGDLDAWS